MQNNSFYITLTFLNSMLVLGQKIQGIDDRDSQVTGIFTWRLTFIFHSVQVSIRKLWKNIVNTALPKGNTANYTKVY